MQPLLTVTGLSKTRRMQEAFAAHLQYIVRLYPAEEHKRAMLMIDNEAVKRVLTMRECIEPVFDLLQYAESGMSIRISRMLQQPQSHV